MADNEGAGKSWWSTMPGVLTALGGTITAVAGLVAILVQSGLVGSKADAGKAALASPHADKSATMASTSTPPQVAVAGQDTGAATAAAAPSADPAPAARSPAEVLAGLRSVGFKGLAVTHRDGTVVALAPGAEISGEMLPLSNGQNVQFERLVSIAIEQPWDGSATLTLTNGQRLATRLNDYNLYGKNALGSYRELLSNLKHIDFVR
jgi:hypothetical protein